MKTTVVAALALGALTSTAPAVTIEGRILFRNSPPGLTGYGPPNDLPARGIDVVIESVGATPRVSVSTRTDGNGVFRAATDLTIGSRAGITFQASSAAGIVQDNLGTTYTWTTDAAPATVTGDPFVLGTVTVDESQDAGALNILDVIGSGFGYATSRGAVPLPRVTAVWKKGLQGSSTFYDQRVMKLFLLNAGTAATDDTDEWDDQVIAHEYGHHIQFSASCNLSHGGPWSICDSLAPELAWGEGGANYLSVIVSTLDPQLDHVGANYLDLVGNSAAGSQVVVRWDLESDVCPGGGGPSVPGVVSNLLWDLQDAAADPPDAYTRSEADLFRLMLELKYAPRCDLTEFIETLCWHHPEDMGPSSPLSGLLASFGVQSPSGCPAPARQPIARPDRHNPPPIVPPRPDRP